MSLCWQIIGHNATGGNTQGQLIQPNGQTSTYYVCGNTVTSIEVTVTGGYYAGCLAYVLDINGSYDVSGNSGISAGPHTITQILASSSLASNCSSSCKPSAYDCINGVCTTSTTYSTPGQYPTLIACQSQCGQENCPTCPTCPTCPDLVPCVCDPCTCQAPVPCPDCPPCTCGACVCPPAPSCPPSTPCVQKPCPTCPPATPCTSTPCPPCPLTNPNNNDVQFSTVTIPVFTGDCDDSGNPTMTDQSITVIQGLEQSNLLMYTELANTQGAIACGVTSDVAAIPDNWRIRPEYQRPQVIYQFAQVNDSGTIIGAPKYQIAVPHHTSTEPTNPLPNYQRGNWEIIYVLSDNSKVTIHSYDETNGMTMLTAIKALITPSYLNNSYLAKSCLVVTNTPIAQINVKNRMAKYYSTGTKTDVPDWVVKW